MAILMRKPKLRNSDNVLATKLNAHIVEVEHSGKLFDESLRTMTKAVGLDPDLKGQETKVYNVISAWRKAFIYWWDGLAPEVQTAENFEIYTKTMFPRDYSAHLLICDRVSRHYYKPTYDQKERRDQERFQQWVRALFCVGDEMGVYEEIFSTGESAQKVIDEITPLKRFLLASKQE